MEFFSKSLLNGLTCVGGCFAVGVPAAMHSIGGGDEIVLTYCDKEGTGELNFGIKGTRRVCWSLNNANQELANKEVFTNLFSDNWSKVTEQGLDWSVYDHEKWKQQCEGVGKKWMMSSQDLNIERLGICGPGEYENVPFVKKQKSSENNKTTLKFWVCDEKCWDLASSQELGESKMLKKENADNWKEVKFRRGR